MDTQTVNLENADKLRVHQLYTQSGNTQWASFTIALAYVWLSRATVAQGTLWLWLACYLVLLFGRVLLLMRFRLSYELHLTYGHDFNATAWEGHAARHALLAGLCWGATASLMLPLNDGAYQAFIGFFLGGVTAAGSMAYGASVRASRNLVCAAIIPFMVTLCLATTPHHVQMALLLGFYVLLYRKLAIQLNDYVNQSLRLAFEKQGLSERLDEANLQLERSARLAALGEMAGGIAHEINNPLAVIKGKNQLIQFLIEEKKLTAETLAPLINNIDSTVMRIARIVSGIKTLAHGGAGEEWAPARVKDFVSETIELSKPRFKSHNIKLDCETIRPGLEIECRPVQLEQVLLNLLNNAFDAVVEQTAKWVKIQVEETDVNLCIKVTDSGPGLPEALKEKVGSVRYTTKKLGKGTGLGLKISANIIKDHAGTLSIDTSQPHTTFVITLPKKRVATPALATAAA